MKNFWLYALIGLAMVVGLALIVAGTVGAAPLLDDANPPAEVTFTVTTTTDALHGDKVRCVSVDTMANGKLLIDVDHAVFHTSTNKSICQNGDTLYTVAYEIGTWPNKTQYVKNSPWFGFGNLSDGTYTVSKR